MEQPLERLRAICLALPETIERLSHGEPTFFVRGKKVFATFTDHHHDDRLSFWCHAPAGAQQSLVAADPQRFFVPPYGILLGFVCIPVDPTGDQGICVHVWSDSLPSARLTTSSMHAHSWDLISYVLYGSVRNELIDVTDAPDDLAYRVFEVRSGADVDELRETPRLVRCESAQQNSTGRATPTPCRRESSTPLRFRGRCPPSPWAPVVPAP